MAIIEIDLCYPVLVLQLAPEQQLSTRSSQKYLARPINIVRIVVAQKV